MKTTTELFKVEKPNGTWTIVVNRYSVIMNTQNSYIFHSRKYDINPYGSIRPAHMSRWATDQTESKQFWRCSPIFHKCNCKVPAEIRALYLLHNL